MAGKSKAEKAAEKRARQRALKKEKKKLLNEQKLAIEQKNEQLQEELAAQRVLALQPTPVKGDKQNNNKTNASEAKVETPVIEDEYTSSLNLDDVDDEFRKVFEAFASKGRNNDDNEAEQEALKAEEEAAALAKQKAGENEDEEEEENKTLSNRKKKEKNRLSIAELKQLVDRPEVVNIHDCNSTDPKLLVMLKTYPNTVVVPRHWADRRKYLQGKRGLEKPLYQLPPEIAATGIGEIRQSMAEKAEGKKLKSSAREKMRPKSGRMDMDYHMLHDAFFVNQTKPVMTSHNDLYYEGKEYEAKLQKKRPGTLSAELMRALGMTEGNKSPAPWLTNQQRFGPPPSYPNLKIPGVNWPIPEGCRYGMLEGEWGKPPVDEYGRPLYGDVFGTELKEEDTGPSEVVLWGMLQEEEEGDDSELESEEEDEEDVENEDVDEDMDEDAEASGTASTVSSFSGLSTPSGLTTPDVANIRRDVETPTEQRQLYTVLEEKKASIGGGLFGSDRTYVLPAATGHDSNSEVEQKKKALRGQVDVVLNPDEIENLDAASLKRKYEAQLKAGSKQASQALSGLERSEVDEIIEDEARKKKRKLNAGLKKNKAAKFKF